MNAYSKKSIISRRDFLKLILSGGALVSYSAFVEACNRANIALPTSTALPTSLPSSTPVPTLANIATHIPTLNPTSTATLTPTDMPVDLTAGLEGLDIDAFLDESIKRLFLRDPETITIGGLSELLGVRNDQLTNMSDEFIRQTQKLQQGILELLRKYDKNKFSPTQNLNAGVYEWYLDDLVRGFPFMYDDYLVFPYLNSLNWTQQYLFTEVQPFTNEQDAQDYIARLEQLQVKFNQVLEGLIKRQQFGVVLPGILIQDLLDEFEPYTGFIGSHPYNLTFIEKVSSITGLSSEKKQSLKLQAEKAIKNSVIPAYQLLTDHYRQIGGLAPTAIGVSRYSNGAEYYRHLLRHFTTTELSPEEIHQLGFAGVQRIQTEMRSEFAKLGYPANESFISLMNRLANDFGFVIGEQAVEAYQKAIDQATNMLDQAFDFPLKEKIAVIGGEQGNYYTSAPRDGSRPAAFYAMTAYEQPRYNIKGIAFHEAVPGHGYQFDVARQLNPPLFRDAIQCDGYVEGWALYAERLMWELGAYEGDIPSNLGRLNLELLRAVRCVLDTAIHTKQWSYDQAVKYMQTTTGARGEGEIKRYIMWPAQPTAYYVGFLKILELRQKAKDKLGMKFNLKEFHRVVLGSGQVPLAMLEGLVEEYIGGK